MKHGYPRLTYWALLLVVALALPACEKDATVDRSDAAQEARDASAESFQQSLEGIWSTNESEGDDAETLYAIEWLPDAGLRVVRDDSWLNGKVEDTDLDNGTLALHLSSEVGPSETVTVRKIPDKNTGGAFSLRVTWAAGQTEDLGFVRRLTKRDRAMIAEAIAAAKQSTAMGDGPEKSPRCNGAQDSLRLELICNDQVFAMEDQRLLRLFNELSARHPDGDKTAVAANRQLDACKTQKCLRDTYTQWQAYLNENFNLTQEVW